jgi:hypothetical protein
MHTTVAPRLQGEIQDHLEPVHVEERQRGDHDVLGRDAQHLLRMDHGRDQVAVAEQDALRKPGCAARIQDRGDIGGRIDRDIGRGLRVTQQRRKRRRPVRLTEHTQLTPGMCRRLARDLEKLRNGQEHARVCVRELVAELSRRVQRISRRAPPARRDHSVERDRELGHVRHADAERVAPCKATLREPRGQTAHRPLQLGVA